MESNLTIINRLQGVIEKNLYDVFDPSERYALLDFPNHYNIGDSAIWLGELAYFDKKRSRPSYVTEIPTFDEDRMLGAIGDGRIFLHGGGNFGDIWAGYRQFRENMLERHKGRPIVQLPQTIHFKDQANVDSTARAIEKHGQFTLLVRDKKSLAFAQRWFQCETRLCPDMAFCIGPVAKPVPQHELLLNLREDQEVGTPQDLTAATQRPGTVKSDWPDEPADFQKQTKHAAILKGLLSGKIGGRARMTELAYRERAQQRFDRGVALLGSARQVITDRMHGHIMCVLIGADHCVLDNSYGKTSSFIEAWNTCNTEKAELAATVDEALDILDARRMQKQAAVA
ncbi:MULTISPECIES: polysaccharide pyruvyl transferase family protein [unclassified Rhizobium]|uniref:polysaccharide pyruvyl transferase family protein n=1 Tax=unclassified Rhizobium TaxID=2613769 RepID=UPI001ADA1412|nr:MULTISPECIES: polysaccharide pyruvyl transferase family protein [unclassified Rhizobium]MBO9122648.1 polysaccharide pyruvyl transferase family protein [Rhizobium sp. 16-488-2b]MBO9173180.1 polysaccharide pyruvyl transferase family protein [Rhizobium sp. 16-488-2a]